MKGCLFLITEVDLVLRPIVKESPMDDALSYSSSAIIRRTWVLCQGFRLRRKTLKLPTLTRMCASGLSSGCTMTWLFHCTGKCVRHEVFKQPV